MKCLVISDSHRGGDRAILRLLAAHPDAEAVFFLGDGLSDLDVLAGNDTARTYFPVRGNCDYTDTFRDFLVPKTDEVILEGKRIVFTHGDLYGAKYGVGGLLALARERDADVVLFGHTHVPTEICERVGEKTVYLCNPGSIGASPDGRDTFGILTLTGDSVLFSIGEADTLFVKNAPKT